MPAYDAQTHYFGYLGEVSAPTEGNGQMYGQPIIFAGLPNLSLLTPDERMWFDAALSNAQFALSGKTFDDDQFREITYIRAEVMPNGVPDALTATYALIQSVLSDLFQATRKPTIATI